MRLLSIETSCDETSAAVVEKIEESIHVLSTVTASSAVMHASTGGIIPENAAREQVKYIIPVITQALLQSNKETILSAGRQVEQSNHDVLKAQKILKEDIDAIAVTYGPGLIGSLLVGVETAKTLSLVFNKPLIPVNHLLAHLFANFITLNSEPKTVNFPFIGLIVSGGHTDLLYFKSVTNYQWLGGTRDDAAGEAFDKIGRLLDLPYPAGPEIERRSKLVQKPSIKFKSPLLHSEDLDFSFSGLKTEAMRFIQKTTINDEQKNHICYAVQKAIIDVLVSKTLKAAQQFHCTTILLGGGVAANQTLMETLRLKATSQKPTAKIFSPKKIFCTDNGAMIGAYALMDYKHQDWREVKANPELYFA